MSALRVVFDAEPLIAVRHGSGLTGVGRWTKGAVRSLSEQAPDWRIDLVAMRPRGGVVGVEDLGPNVTLRVVRLSPRTFRRLSLLQLAPAIERLTGPADAVVGTNYVTWRSKKAAELPVIYDLSFIHEPKTVSPRNLAYLRMMLPRTIDRARIVITISQTIREEIAAHYGFPQDRIVVVPPGCDPGIFDSAPRPIDVPERFLLSVATLEPRKNLQRLVSAHADLRKRSQRTPPLVIAGGRGWRMGDPAALFRDEIERGDLLMKGFVSDDELAALYKHAEALLFPSLYEGFGLPIIEAMAARCPVVTSDRSGMAEVAGDAALLVDPESEESISQAIARLIEDPELRADLVEKGQSRALLFPWSETGRRLKEAILRAAH